MENLTTDLDSATTVRESAPMANVSDSGSTINLLDMHSLSRVIGVTFEDALPHIITTLLIIEYALMAVIFCGNSFIQLSYFYSRMGYKNNARLSPSGRMVLNLSLADLLVSVGLCYFTIFKFWPDLAGKLARHRIPCLLRFATCFFTMVGSHTALLIISLDRYIAIVHTLHYKDIMTTRLSWVMITVAWLLPASGASAVFLLNEWTPEVTSCEEHIVVPDFLLHFALPTNVIVLAVVSLIHWAVHREVKAYNLRRSNPDFVASSSKVRHGSRKSAKILLQVTGTFILCWTPLDVVLSAFILLGPSPPLVVAFEGAFMLAMTSFLINPFIYSWKTEAIRKPLVAVLVKLGVYQPEPKPHATAAARRRVFALSDQEQQSVTNSSSAFSTSTGSGAGLTRNPG